MSFNLNEMVQTLSYVTGTMAIFKEMGQSSVDYSAITPSIIGEQRIIPYAVASVSSHLFCSCASQQSVISPTQKLKIW